MARSVIARDSTRRTNGSGTSGPPGPPGPPGPTGSVQVDNIAALSLLDDSAYFEGQLVYVGNQSVNTPSVHQTWHLESNTTMIPDGITIVLALSGTATWVRDVVGNPYWQYQNTWYFDPAGTNPTGGGAPGNDENSGLSAQYPLRTMAEWRRRIQGANYTGIVQLIALTSSTNPDDAIITGFTTGPVIGTSYVALKGVVTVVHAGTITGYSAPTSNGNNRGSVTDSALPVSWTASAGISSATGTRYIRKAGGATGTAHALLLLDLGSKTCQIGVNSASPESPLDPLNTTIVPFVVGDSYEVFSQLKWPSAPYTRAQGRVKTYTIDFANSQFGIGDVGSFIMCGFLTFINNPACAGVMNVYNCWFTGGSSTASAATFNARGSAFVNGVFQLGAGASSNWNGSFNVFINCDLNIWHGANGGTLGTISSYDNNASSCVSVRRTSLAYLDALNGTGNTGLLITVDTGGILWGGSNATAITTNPLPFRLNGVSFASPPGLDADSGNALYG